MTKRKKNTNQTDTQKEYKRGSNPVQESIVSSLEEDGWQIITFEKD